MRKRGDCPPERSIKNDSQTIPELNDVARSPGQANRLRLAVRSLRERQKRFEWRNETELESSVESVDHRLFSLPLALAGLAEPDGVELEALDIVAAMGLPWWVVTPSEEPNSARWSHYTRDAFLDETAAVVGLSIRPVHPPEAARGLSGAAEFAQHFEASYRPFIDRALENSQMVLAWRGWSAPFDWSWGVIDTRRDEGLGYGGRIWTSDETLGDRRYHQAVLMAPATQLYVVERRAWREPSAETWVSVAFRAASLAVSEGAGRGMCVDSGVAAIEAWKRTLRSTRGAAASLAAAQTNEACAHQHAMLAACGVRFLNRHRVPIVRVFGEKAAERWLAGTKALHAAWKSTALVFASSDAPLNSALLESSLDSALAAIQALRDVCDPRPL